MCDLGCARRRALAGIPLFCPVPPCWTSGNSNGSRRGRSDCRRQPPTVLLARRVASAASDCHRIDTARRNPASNLSRDASSADKRWSGKFAASCLALRLPAGLSAVSFWLCLGDFGSPPRCHHRVRNGLCPYQFGEGQVTQMSSSSRTVTVSDAGKRPRVVGRSRYRIMSNIGLGILIFIALFPVLWLVYTSFRSDADIIGNPTSLIPTTITFENYITPWNGTNHPKLLLNSLITSTITVVVSLPLATLAAYSLSRAKFRGKGIVYITYLAVRIVPGVLLLFPLYILIQQLGLLDTHFALVITYITFTLPAVLWFMKGFFDSIPVDLENAARVDGCSRMGALFRIVIPLVRPGLAASAVLIAIESWNDVLFALMLTSSDASRTWPVGLRLLIGDFQLPWGQLAAATVLSIIPVVIGFTLVGKAMVAGLTAGGVKD